MSGDMTFISAGAGSGKTYALTKALNIYLQSGRVKPKSVIATTFTRMAAKDLKDRVREALIEIDQIALSEQIELARIGTVNSVCGRLLEDFAFEAGIPPGQETLDEGRAGLMFRRALDQINRQNQDLIAKLIRVANRLSVEDWEGEVKRIVDSARANNIKPGAIRSFADSSAQSLLTYFPKPSETFTNADLDNALNRAISGIQNLIDQGLDKTGTTKDYLYKKIRPARSKLSEGDLPWATWASLGKSSPGAKSREFGNLVQHAAVDFGQHKKLHEDIKFFTGTLFKIAADSLETYQAFKAQRGLVDFVDQEQRLFETLDDQSVQERLSFGLDLLMVDEFQDTSPIQLAVFMKLAALSKNAIFVGDVKQSIYGFRGADPSLMEAILKNLDTLNMEDQVLENSWRSRPPLVHLVNDIFKTTFSNILREDQITLEPKRDDIEGETAFESWELSGKTIAEKLNALAQGVNKLIQSNKKIIDKASNTLRDARFSDVAVLCRTHARLEVLSEALKDQGIPSRFVRPGLLETPEAKLALACLRRLVDPSDVLAAAEIHTLSTCESPEGWLPARLEQLSKEDSNYREWMLDPLGIFEALQKSKERLSFLTPVETLRLALAAAKVEQTVTQWSVSGEHAKLRRANLNRLIEIAEDYVAECELESEPATVAGLIFYFDQINGDKLDTQAPTGADNAVNILTHHAAKGLEWPIVILYDLDDSPKTRIWGLTVQANPDGISIEDPLGGRTLRYWPPLFDKNKTGIDILDDIMGGEEAQSASARELSELQRLLYVSMTRARDCMIFALPAKKTAKYPWIETLGLGHFWPGAENESFPAEKYMGAHKSFEFEEIGEIVPNAYQPEVVSYRFEDEKLSALLYPSGFEPLPGAKVTETIELGNRLPVQDKYDVSIMGNALHAVIASHLMGQDAATEILQRHKMDKAISAIHALTSAKRLESFINKRFGDCEIHCEYPVKYTNGKGQIISGWIDLLVETEDGLVIIDHKASPQQRSEWSNIALGYSGQLGAYQAAFAKNAKAKVTECWVHFALTGGIVKVDPQTS